MELQHEQCLIDQLGVINKQEAIYWKQRSRLQWLKDGDENTKFFHAVANGRKNRNFIPCLRRDGVELVDPKEIGKAFVERFTV